MSGVCVCSHGGGQLADIYRGYLYAVALVRLELYSRALWFGD